MIIINGQGLVFQFLIKHELVYLIWNLLIEEVIFRISIWRSGRSLDWLKNFNYQTANIWFTCCTLSLNSLSRVPKEALLPMACLNSLFFYFPHNGLKWFFHWGWSTLQHPLWFQIDKNRLKGPLWSLSNYKLVFEFIKWMK